MRPAKNPYNTRAVTQTSPVANPALVAQGPQNSNYGTLNLPSVSESFGVGALASIIDGQSNRIQVNQSPNPIPSVFDPISSHIPVKIKERVWAGEFIDLNLLLNSARDLADESHLEGDLTVRGGVLSVIKPQKSQFKSIHVWTSAFMIYASIILEKWPNKVLELFKCIQTVRLAASMGYFGSWIQYDEQYRLRKAISPCSSWGVVDKWCVVYQVRVITVFTVFRLLTDFVCLYTYEF
jgi:hypothetical protein